MGGLPTRASILVLITLPPLSDRRLAVRVTPDATRQIRGGHPWIFASSIASVSDGGTTGDLAVVFDRNRRFLAIGLYDPESPIRIRMLHHGPPVTIDSSFWSERLDAARAIRQPLELTTETTAYRIINGENDGFPGLVLDRYASTLVLKLYSAAWLPHLGVLVPLIQARWQPASVVLRISRALQRDHPELEGTSLVGPLPTAPVQFIENGLSFEADVIRGQKTGHFLDQRDNRNCVRALAGNARVLDVFACTGGFSAYAAAGGAVEVHSVDISAGALKASATNVRANNPGGSTKHLTTVGDAFEVMRTLVAEGERYDVVVIDPPSFAHRRSEAAGGLRAYRQLTELGLALTADGGTLVQASCSSRISAVSFFESVESTARAVGASVTVLEKSEHPIDHPIGFVHGAYLKAMFLRVNRHRS